MLQGKGGERYLFYTLLSNVCGTVLLQAILYDLTLYMVNSW